MVFKILPSYLLQLNNDPKDRDQVVILFQDMLEVVTRDIMMEDPHDNIFRWCMCRFLSLHH